MCGRYSLAHNTLILEELFEAKLPVPLAPRYNIAPSQPALIVRNIPEVGNVFDHVTWGLVPFWEKNLGSGNHPCNARSETILEKKMFRNAFLRRRCLVPASGFYEWRSVEIPRESDSGDFFGGVVRKPQTVKIPYYINASDGGILAFAGIQEVATGQNGEEWHTMAILTTEANATMSPLHHRMPVIVQRSDWDRWLETPETELGGVLELLKPAPEDVLSCHTVSRAVNRPGCDGPELIEPVRYAEVSE